MADNFFSSDIGYEPKVNFDNPKLPKVEIKNGSPLLIDQIEAVRQWIFKFTLTQKDKYRIYEGTDFGTRIKELYGHKRIGYGFEEAEIERDYREGLPLCPAISQVSSFSINKQGNTLNIEMDVQLYNGDLITVNIEDKYTIKF